MFPARLSAVCLALLVLAQGASAHPNRLRAPIGLQPFLLRVDDPAATSFARTPSFAWKPVASASRYQFQLATSPAFDESAIVFQAGNLTSPVAAPTTTLPWLTGDPHAYYARVRAFVRTAATPWSKPFGFDLTAPAAPTPLPGYDGLLRWTPVDGASGYEVWFVDVPKIERVWTNVVDERELYTFHHDATWTHTVHWRVRAVRMDEDGGKLASGLVPETYGPWSAVYQSTNNAFAGGPIKLVAAVSDAVSSGSPSSAPHALMPGFVFQGDQALDGRTAELFRLYVFSDRQCLNRVYTSAVVGSPAYAPRPHGPLPLPLTEAALPNARVSYLSQDGKEPDGFSADGAAAQTTESLAPATPTTAAPSDSALAGPAADGAQQLTVAGDLGAPVDLADTTAGASYYWTVVPVQAVSPGKLATTAAAPGSLAGDTGITVASSAGFNPGEIVTVGSGLTAEPATIATATANVLTFTAPLKYAHAASEPVVRSGGDLQYRDLELAQDACAAGRVASFAKASAPGLTASGRPFASGLSSTGRLVGGTGSTRFYGSPLVAWSPAPGANAYEVQWSRTASPFKAAPDPEHGNATGRLTFSTSAVLPLKPGTWFYRVRGLGFALPTGAQGLTWSAPTKIVVAKPRFKVLPR